MGGKIKYELQFPNTFCKLFSKIKYEFSKISRLVLMQNKILKKKKKGGIQTGHMIWLLGDAYHMFDQ